MPNDLVRSWVITSVHKAIREFQDAGGIDHPFMRGRVREIAVNNLFKPLLPGYFDLGTGKIIDNQGVQSLETDLVIYSKNVLPPIMYSEREGIFPAEACFYAIEIKSKLTATEIRDAIAKAERLRALQYMPGAYTHRAEGVSHPILPIIPALFAFTSDLVEGGRSELDRYREIDEHFSVGARISAICVVGRGYWWFRGHDRKWIFHPPTDDRDEVIDFLSGVINTIPDSFMQRGRPRLGNYLIFPERGSPVET